MTSPSWFISVASWEDRFRLGTQRILESHSISQAILFYYLESKELTAENRKAVVKAFEQKGIEYKEVPISNGDPAAAWHLLATEASDVPANRNPLLDITTMPRDTIWYLMSLLEQQALTVKFVYHCPEVYGAWQSRDPGRPRLVYKLSGVAELGRSTCLIVVTGFDPERTRQLMWHYEPHQVILVFQSGEQYDNENKNIEKHRKALKDEYDEFDVQEQKVDAYSSDCGRSVLMKLVKEKTQESNVIMTSLGPKLGAIALYEVHCAFPETGLVYTPSGEFNLEYSKGLSDTVDGVVNQ